MNGNLAVSATLSEMAGMQTFAREFIQHSVIINLESALAPFGLKVARFGSRSQITVMGQLSRHQRDLLHELGYNDEARPSGRNRSRNN